MSGRGVKKGLSPPLLITSSSLSPVLIPLPSYSSSSIKVMVLCGEVVVLLAKGVIEPVPPPPCKQISV